MLDTFHEGENSAELGMEKIDQTRALEEPHHNLGRVLVVGLGNGLASDDAVGLQVISQLRQQGLVACSFLELAQMDVLEILDEADTIVFVDALVSGAAPGTVQLLALSASEMESRNEAAFSLHGWSLKEILELRGALGLHSPRMFLLGIEIESAAPGTELSAAVQMAVKKVVQHFPQLLDQLQEGTERRLWEPDTATDRTIGDIYVAHQT
jgi:hydrogenase maturation protease